MIINNPLSSALRTKLQRDYNWEVILPDIAGIPGLLVSELCQDIKLGEYSMTELSTLRAGAMVTRYAGFFDVEPFSITFLKPIPDLVSSYLLAWRRLIITDDGLYFAKSSYSKQVYLKLHDRTGIDSFQLKMLGVFPKKFPYYDLSYTKEGIVYHDIQFNVDRIVSSLF